MEDINKSVELDFNAEQSVNVENLDQDQKNEKQEIVQFELKENGNMVYIIFLFWGIGSLMTSSAIFSTLDYYVLKSGSSSPLTTYSFANLGPQCMSQLVMLFYGHLLSDRIKIQIAFALVGLLVMAMPFVASIQQIDQSVNQVYDVNYWSCFGILVLLGIFCGFVASQIFSLAAILPSKYMGILSVGQGVSGVSMNIFKMALIPQFPDSNNINEQFTLTLIFNCIGAAILFLCSYFYTALMNNEYYQAALEQNLQDGIEKQGDYISQIHSLSKQQTNNTLYTCYTDAENDEKNKIELTKKESFSKKSEKLNKRMSTRLSTQQHEGWRHKYQQLQGSKTMLFCLGSVFFFTFMIFPGVFVNGHLSFAPSFSWNLIFILFGFNAFDTIGRTLGGKLHISEKLVATLALLRLAFIPTTLVINYYDAQLGDTIKLLNLIIFALSNGYVSTQCCIKAPQYAKDEYKQTVGILVGLLIPVGIMLGSIVQLGLGGLPKYDWSDKQE